MKKFKVLLRIFISMTCPLLFATSIAASGNSSDTCILPQVVGRCLANIPAWWYNSTSNQCEKFIYGGCGGNDNNFQTKEQCTERCNPLKICNLPADQGPCFAEISAWWYNSTKRKCEQFTYGGCPGNSNNFKTKIDCLKLCKPSMICKLPKDPGPCRASFTRWWYNSATDECNEFIYGGCKGNANNFRTKEECLKTCYNRV